MTLMEWKYTNGFSPSEFATSVEIDDDAALTDAQKDLFVAVTASAASKSLVLGLAPGQHMIVTNIGDTNALTIKAITGDTGSSLAAGKTALVIGSGTANASAILVLN